VTNEGDENKTPKRVTVLVPHIHGGNAVSIFLEIKRLGVKWTK